MLLCNLRLYMVLDLKYPATNRSRHRGLLTYQVFPISLGNKKWDRVLASYSELLYEFNLGFGKRVAQ